MKSCRVRKKNCESNATVSVVVTPQNQEKENKHSHTEPRTSAILQYDPRPHDPMTSTTIMSSLNSSMYYSETRSTCTKWISRIWLCYTDTANGDHFKYVFFGDRIKTHKQDQPHLTIARPTLINGHQFHVDPLIALVHPSITLNPKP